MFSSGDVICIIVSIVGALIAWNTLMWLFRCTDGPRPQVTEENCVTSKRPRERADARHAKIEYHNTAIYKALEFYVKVVLAILGGTVYVAFNAPEDRQTTIAAVQNGACGIMVVVTFLFCAVIASHQHSKIQRWTRHFRWYELLTWSETWMFTCAIVIATMTCCWFVPSLA